MCVNSSICVHQGLAVGEPPQLVAFEEIARQVAHLQQEAQIALLRAHAGVGPLDDLDHAHGFLVALQRG